MTHHETSSHDKYPVALPPSSVVRLRSGARVISCTPFTLLLLLLLLRWSLLLLRLLLRAKTCT
jgi:hypothetical protein